MAKPDGQANAIDYFRRNAIERYLELGLNTSQIQDQFKGTELAQRRTNLLAEIREVRATMESGSTLRQAEGGNLLNPNTFATTEMRMPTRFYVDADVTILTGEGGELVDIKRRVWFNDDMSKDELDALIEESSGEAYGNLVVDINITAAARRA